MKKPARAAGRKAGAKKSTSKKTARKKTTTGRRKPIMRHSREG